MKKEYWFVENDKGELLAYADTLTELYPELCDGSKRIITRVKSSQRIPAAVHRYVIKTMVKQPFLGHIAATYLLH